MQFWLTEVGFLGHVVISVCIMVDPKKVETVTQWPWPTSVMEIQSFVGIIRYYRQFIKNYFKVVTPLTQLIRKNIKFEYDNAYEQGFQELKNILIFVDVLTLPSGTEGYTIFL